MKDMNKLHGKSGADFDKDFMSRMVKDHEKDLKEVQKAQKDAEKDKHAQLATVLAATATGMQGHLDEAKRLKDTVGKGARAQGRRGQMGASEGKEMGSGGTGSLGTGGSASGSSSSGSMTTPPASGSKNAPSGASTGSSATPGQQGTGSSH